MSNFLSLFLALIIAAVTYGTPLLFGTLGEILTEKSGNLNLGVEGIMFMGGALGLGGVFYYEKAAGAGANGMIAVGVGILCAFLAGALARTSPAWPCPSSAPAWASSSASTCGSGRTAILPSATR